MVGAEKMMGVVWEWEHLRWSESAQAAENRDQAKISGGQNLPTKSPGQNLRRTDSPVGQKLPVKISDNIKN